ncbi:sensor histidine kinase [Parvularcula dongshanensis]|uniref:histidine kinase n=1 Tax=Parvularcula dongshanensis TaxID=1173995 RepID=A0A840I6L4_9PROT|nr:HAMP domain-containing sensor histidine kinase [Parvularcula dongshanensis]MBB4660102.1 signal transduction histidine kinase [Parvularcula dongshanensis]
MADGVTGGGTEAVSRPARTESERLDLSLKAMKVVRHDLRNLLASVTIIADRIAALEDTRLAAAGPHLVTSMEQTVALSRAAQELCEVAPGSPETLALGGVASDAVDSVEGAKVSFEGLEGVSVKGDREQLRRLFAHLIDNAMRATGPDGSVTLSAVPGPQAVTLTLSDTGQGVPDYAFADLLVPFAGAKRRGGTGLGLPIAASLAAANGGELHVERSGADGTVVIVTLPSP